MFEGAGAAPRGKPLFTVMPSGPVPRSGLSIAKAQSELGFKSKVTFEEGVCHSAEWFLKTWNIQSYGA
jgi:nucleoside-diphosphate-sugar epimerase